MNRFFFLCRSHLIYLIYIIIFFFPDPSTGTVTGQFGVLCSDGAFVQPTAWPLETACVITDTWSQLQPSFLAWDYSKKLDRFKDMFYNNSPAFLELKP